MPSVITLAARLLPPLIALAFLPNLSAISVWINEIHYDNDGADFDEFVEVAGTAGTDLTGYTLYFYNGATGALYSPSVGLTGILPNESNRFGTLAFNRPGIQNGSPDGIALAGPGDAFIQFLSYEGSFLGVGGIANGKTSEDIGVSQDGSPIGQTLQLVGHGSVYSDFAWTGPATGSRATINAKQSFESVPDSASILSLGAISLLGLISFRRLQRHR